jgi:hypothetical protein
MTIIIVKFSNKIQIEPEEIEKDKKLDTKIEEKVKGIFTFIIRNSNYNE